MPKAHDQNSKLITRLREISRGAPAPIGFGRAPLAAAPAMLLLAVIPRNDVGIAEAAVRGGANAIALRICGAGTDLLRETGDVAAEAQVIRETQQAINERAIVGLIVGSNGALAAGQLAEVADLGVDFIAMYPHLTPAGFLELSTVGRIAILDHQGGSVARGINDLSIQAALVRLERPSDSPPEMSVLDVAAYRAVADVVHRPMIVFPSWKSVPDDLEVLKNAGIEGLAIVGPKPDATADEVEATIHPYREMVQRLGKPTGRRIALTEPAVILPRAASAPGGEAVEEPDEDDE